MSHSIIIFGASGDLTSRKLIPALYLLHGKGRLPEETRVIGVSRTKFSHDAWRSELAKTTAEFTGSQFQADAWDKFAKTLFYQSGDIARAEDFQSLKTLLESLEADDETCARVYYLSTAPSLYEQAIAQLGAAHLAEETCGPRRIVVEKPFGTDLNSGAAVEHEVARGLRRGIRSIGSTITWAKRRCKTCWCCVSPTVSSSRCGTANYVDHVQITVAEEVVVGSRAGYYDHSGVLRDMFQNHLLQLLTITAMEAPARFDANLVRDEKVKVLRSVRPLAGADFRSRYRSRPLRGLHR